MFVGLEVAEEEKVHIAHPVAIGMSTARKMAAPRVNIGHNFQVLVLVEVHQGNREAMVGREACGLKRFDSCVRQNYSITMHFPSCLAYAMFFFTCCKIHISNAITRSI